MGTDEGGEAVGLDRHITEPTDEHVGILKGAGQQAIGGRGSAVLAADIRAYAGAQGAHHGGGGGAELDQIGHADTVLVVRAVPDLHLGDDVLQAVVGRARHLRAGEDDAAVGTTTGSGGLGPAGGVVEAQPHRLAGEIVAAPGRALELGRHVVDDILPDTARVFGTGGGALLGHVGVGGGRLTRLTTRDDVLDRGPNWRQAVGSDGEKVTNQLGGITTILAGFDFGEHILHAGVGRNGRQAGEESEESGQLHSEMKELGKNS